jgi:hypothetical protein
MKSLRMFKLPVLLLGVGGALLFAPGCKAQEVSPDQFTATGVADVYHASAPSKTAKTAVKLKSNAQVSPLRAGQADSRPNLQLASNIAAVPAQSAAQPAERKRKPASSSPKKP